MRFKEWCIDNQEYIINQLPNIDSSIPYDDMKINNAYILSIRPVYGDIWHKLVPPKPKGGAKSYLIYIVEKFPIKGRGIQYGYYIGTMNMRLNRYKCNYWKFVDFHYIQKNSFFGYYIIPLTISKTKKYLNWINRNPLEVKECII